MRARRIRHALGCAGFAVLGGALVGTAMVATAGANLRPAIPASTTNGVGRTLASDARFYVPPPASGSRQQEMQLLGSGNVQDAKLIAAMLQTPQAVWFTGGTPAQVQQQVSQTMSRAALQRSVPVLVAYNIPGRDCAQYSSGGALNEQAYQQWISAFAAGIGQGKAVVILEPDALANLPSDCASGTTAYPFTDTARLTEVSYAVNALEADPNVGVYLDGGNSAWQSVGTMAQTLVAAGVQNAQGFFLNVSNYQFTQNSVQYGTWVSDCIAYATVISPSNYANCPNQYWNGGPSGDIATLLGAWNGVALSPYGIWSATTTLSNADLNISGINVRYAGMLGSTIPTTHFVVDTSRNGVGPNDMSAYAASPYFQSAATVDALAAANWCNPPGTGLGTAPTANTGTPLVDAYLWVKTPGQSDGQCDAAGGVRAWNYNLYNPWNVSTSAQSTFDPLWGQVDPAAGAWFPAQALQLVKNASPALDTSGIGPLPAFGPFGGPGGPRGPDNSRSYGGPPAS